MINESIIITNKLGLHTRAAAKVVALATQFESSIQFQFNDKTADCKSIMALILLGLTKGASLHLVISGTDEIAARDAIVTLINQRFGEAE
jgi:phosphotransferase system HPr (HPr) family protein